MEVQIFSVEADYSAPPPSLSFFYSSGRIEKRGAENLISKAGVCFGLCHLTLLRAYFQ